MFIRFDGRFKLALIELVSMFKLGCNARSLRTTVCTFYHFEVMRIRITADCPSGNHREQCVNRSSWIGRPSSVAAIFLKNLRHNVLSKLRVCAGGHVKL